MIKGGFRFRGKKGIILFIGEVCRVVHFIPVVTILMPFIPVIGVQILILCTNQTSVGRGFCVFSHWSYYQCANSTLTCLLAWSIKLTWFPKMFDTKIPWILINIYDLRPRVMTFFCKNPFSVTPLCMKPVPGYEQY